MDSLNCLSYQTLRLLNKNRLLLPLVKAEVIKSELSIIEIPETQQNELFQLFKNKLGIVNNEDLEKWMQVNNYDDGDIQHIYLSEVRIKKYCQEHYSHKIEAHFLKRKSELDIVIYSLLRLANRAIADELYLRIVEKEEEFGDLATKYSQGIERKTRGIIGPGPLGAMHPKLAKHISQSTPGETQAPIEVDGNQLIIRVESFDAAKLDKFMRDKMGEELFASMVETKAKNIISKLMTNFESRDNKKSLVGA